MVQIIKDFATVLAISGVMAGVGTLVFTGPLNELVLTTKWALVFALVLAYAAGVVVGYASSRSQR